MRGRRVRTPGERFGESPRDSPGESRGESPGESLGESPGAGLHVQVGQGDHQVTEAFRFFRFQLDAPPVVWSIIHNTCKL